MVLVLRFIKQTKKLYILGGNAGWSGMEKVRPQTNNTKQIKETWTTVPKKMLTQSLTQCLDVKEVEVLSKSDVLKIYRKRL